MKHYVLIFIILSGFIPSTLEADTLKGDLTVFHAGSLAIPFKEIGDKFMKLHPYVQVLREASGSRTAARKICDLKRRCDVMASADYTVIDNLLIPKCASFRISFATNEMAIMYTKNSRYAKEITPSNWYKILLRKGVEYGHSDPNTDPCGYRTLIVWQLAENYYKKPGLYRMLISHCARRNIRPKEVDLISLLEAGELDYIFIYRSVCEQHQKPYIYLPQMISLKNHRYDLFYSKASLKITGKRPGTFVIKKGKSMTYAVTIPRNAPNRRVAIEFVKFLLSDQGRKIMEKNGQPSIWPAIAKGYETMPDDLKPLCRPE